jgi:hypothetical protein
MDNILFEKQKQQEAEEILKRQQIHQNIATR